MVGARAGFDVLVKYIGDEHVAWGVRDANLRLRPHKCCLRCHAACPENRYFILLDSYRLAKIGSSEIFNADLLRITNMHRTSMN